MTKKKGVRKGEFFPPCTEEDVFPSSVSFPFYIFRFFSAYAVGCLFLGIMRGVFFPLIIIIMDFAVNYIDRESFLAKICNLGWFFYLLVYTIDSLRYPITNLGHDRKRKTVTTEEEQHLPRWFFSAF